MSSEESGDDLQHHPGARLVTSFLFWVLILAFVTLAWWGSDILVKLLT